METNRKDSQQLGYKKMIDIPARYDLTYNEMNIIYDLKDIWEIIINSYRLGFNRGFRYGKKKKKAKIILTATKQIINY